MHIIKFHKHESSLLNELHEAIHLLLACNLLISILYLIFFMAIYLITNLYYKTN